MPIDGSPKLEARFFDHWRVRLDDAMARHESIAISRSPSSHSACRRRSAIVPASVSRSVWLSKRRHALGGWRLINVGFSLSGRVLSRGFVWGMRRCVL